MERSSPGADAYDPSGHSLPAYLSAIASESSNTIRARNDREALRPIYLNGVEVGFAYAQNDVDKRLSVRGLTIALFHFLAAGHQVLALLPHCFKLYREKCTDHEELLALHRMNLVEFTPGYGSDKYVEVNRLAAGAAFESAGCIVARSQMHAVVSERPCLEEIVEKRLLMPSFMGEDIIFPIDGPLGRIGASLADTLICRPTEADYAACSRSQLLLADQIIWLQRLSNLLPEKLTWSTLASHFATWQPPARTAVVAESMNDTGLCVTLAGPIRPPETNPVHGRGFAAVRKKGNTFARDHYNCPERLRDTKDPATEVNDDDDDEFLPSYAVGERDRTSEAHNQLQRQMPPPPSHPVDPLDDGQELHIGRPGSLYRIVSADEMASREREHSTAVIAQPPAAKPAETIIGGSAFRRGMGDFEERQIPGPRRFGFGASPPRRGNSSNGPPTMIYERPPSPRASSSNYSDTPRPASILPPSSSAARALLQLESSSPPLGRRMSVPSVRPSTDVRNNGSRTDVIVEDRQQSQPQQQSVHPVFSQLALVLGFELAKRVTERHPHELDLNRLANLALDITAAPVATEPAVPAAAMPSRSVSTTSAASAASTASQEHHRRRGNVGSSFNRGGGNRSPQSDPTTRHFGRVGGRVTSPLDRSARSTPNGTAVDTFVTAVSPATAAVAVPPEPLPSSTPSHMAALVDDATADVPRTDASGADEVVDVAIVYDLIDWEGEAAPQEAVHPVSSSSAPLLTESSHLLD